MTEEPTVLVRLEGNVGHLVLNRPRAINALTHEMVRILTQTLQEWESDERVSAVLLTGAGERGLCAGGDIVALYHDAIAKGTEGADFWRDEYHLNALISSYPKPFVAVMDGIVLGGGIGLAAHASVRIVTEKSSIGLPEVGIGFLPDVGGTWLLSHAPGELGTHLGLTAGSVGAGDAIAVGLADHYLPSSSLPDLLSGDLLEQVIKLSEPAPESELLAQRDWIDECYAGDDLAAILDRLDAVGSEAANRAAVKIRRASPTSCAVTLKALRIARQLPSLLDALDQEFRLAVRIQRTPDFVEGVRAQVIDKDRNPQWDPPTIADVDASSIDQFFDPLEPAAELGLSAASAKEHA